MKLALLLTLFTTAFYTFSMEEVTMKMPSQGVLREQLKLCYCDPNLLAPIYELAGQEITASRLKAAIDASLEGHIKTAEFKAVLYLTKQMLSSRLDKKGIYDLCIETKKNMILDDLCQEVPKMKAAVQALLPPS